MKSLFLLVHLSDFSCSTSHVAGTYLSENDAISFTLSLIHI